MLEEREREAVRSACGRVKDTLTLYLSLPDPADSFGKDLGDFAGEIAELSGGRVRIEEGGSPALAGKPSITVTGTGTGTVHYSAMPRGTELEPFLDLLVWTGGVHRPELPAAAGRLDGIRKPVDLLVLMAETCPNCPVVVRAALSLTVSRPAVDLIIADVMRFPDLAERYSVKSTPTVVIDGEATYVGRMDTKTLIERIAESREAGSLTKVIASMIEAGRAEDAARVLCSRKEPEAILPIYRSGEFSTRMGALLVMEEALGIDSRILDPLVGKLVGLLSLDDTSLRGDTAELLGRIGRSEALPALREAANDPNPDVREAARDAIERIERG